TSIQLDGTTLPVVAVVTRELAGGDDRGRGVLGLDGSAVIGRVIAREGAPRDGELAGIADEGRSALSAGGVVVELATPDAQRTRFLHVDRAAHAARGLAVLDGAVDHRQDAVIAPEDRATVHRGAVRDRQALHGQG